MQILCHKFFKIYIILLILSTLTCTLHAENQIKDTSALVKARTENALHHYISAKNYYMQALNSKNSEELLEEYLMFVISHGSWEEIYPVAKAILQLDKKHNLSNLVVSINYIKQNQLQKAIDFLSKSHPEKNSINDLFLITLKGINLYQNNQKDDFKKISENIAKYAPDLYHLQLGYFNILNENNSDAKQNFNYLISNYPTLDSTLEYAKILYTNNKEEGISFFQDILSDNYITDEKAATYIENLETNTTSIVLSKLLLKISSFASENINPLYSVSERFVLVKLSLLLYPSNNLSIYSVSSFYESIGDYDSALSYYKMMSQSSYFKRITQEHVIEYLQQLNKYNEALNIAKSSAYEDSNNPIPYIEIGNIYHKQNEFANAITAYSNALSISEKNNYKLGIWLSHYLRGISYNRNNDWKKSEDDLVTSYNLNPDNPLLLNYLAFSWIDRDYNLDKAMSLLEKALILTKESTPSILDSYALGLLKTNQLDKAIIYEKKALSMNPYDAQFLEHYGDIMWQNGYKQKALSYWNKSLTFYKNSDDLSRVSDKIGGSLPKYLDKDVPEKQYKEDNFVDFAKESKKSITPVK